MNGYWYGIYTGSNSGQIVVEVDDMGDHFYGSAYVYDNNPLMPSTWAEIKTPNKSDRLQRDCYLCIPILANSSNGIKLQVGILA